MATTTRKSTKTTTRGRKTTAEPDKPRTQATVLPAYLDDALKQWAAERGLTPSSAVRMILTEKLIHQAK